MAVSCGELCTIGCSGGCLGGCLVGAGTTTAIAALAGTGSAATASLALIV